MAKQNDSSTAKLFVVFAILSALLLSSCSKSKYVKLDRGSRGTEELTVEKFLDESESDWLKDEDNKIYSNTKTLKFEGFCRRGTVDVAFFFNDSQHETSTPCDANGKYVWEADVSSDGTYSVKVKALSRDGSALSSLSFGDLVVDSTPPTDVVVTSNLGNSPYRVYSTPTEIEGSVDDDVVSLSGCPTGATLSLDVDADTFNCEITMTEGQSLVLNLVASDFAGNTSSPTLFTVIYQSLSQLTLFHASSTGVLEPLEGTSGTRFLGIFSGGPFYNLQNPKASASGAYRMITGMPEWTKALSEQ